MRLAIVIVAAAFTLSACQTTRLHSGCPPEIKYSRETMKEAAAQLRAMPQNSAVARLVSDLHRMRDACRAAGAK